MMQAARETQAIERTSFWGHVLVFSAQDGILLWLGSALVALKIAKEADTMERMMREQLKLTPRRANLANRTRALIFYRFISI